MLRSTLTLQRARSPAIPFTTPDLAPDISYEQIRYRAHQLWLAAGSPDGQDNEHWLQARAELTSQGYPSESEVGKGDTSEALAARPGPDEAQAEVTVPSASQTDRA